MGKNQGARKGTVVHLAHLVANDKAHIPDRPQERAPDDQGFFRRDFRGYGSDRPQGDRPTFRSEGDDCLLYTSPSPRDVEESRMPSSA